MLYELGKERRAGGRRTGVAGVSVSAEVVLNESENSTPTEVSSSDGVVGTLSMESMSKSRKFLGRAEASLTLLLCLWLTELLFLIGEVLIEFVSKLSFLEEEEEMLVALVVSIKLIEDWEGCLE